MGRNRRSHLEGGEGGSQDDGAGKFLGGFWAAGPGRRMQDYRKDYIFPFPPKGKKKEKWIHFLMFKMFTSVGVFDMELVGGT